MHIRFALCAVLLTAVTATADDWHPHADIRAAAVAAARASATGPGAAGAQFEADRPDPRLRLARSVPRVN